MKKVRIISLLMVLCAISNLSAAIRSAEEAQILAQAFFANRNQNTRSVSSPVSLVATSLEINPTNATRQTETPAYYIYNQDRTGFVIISGDDRMETILGYSFENTFNKDTIPDNMRFWLNLYSLKQETLDTAKGVAPVRTLTEDTCFASSVDPLLGAIQYDQGDPYNRLCPMVNGKRCMTGCVATALASILSYYRYPAQGTGSTSYTTNTHNISLSMDFSQTVFDWDNILPQYPAGSYNSEQANAIAKLMLACGIACNMDYDPNASGADNYHGQNGLIKYFGFNPYSYRAMSTYYTLEEWMSLIKTELNAKRPIYYTATDNSPSGHAFVIDGYDENGLVHVNWGWSGLSNGYFLITNLQPSESGAGGGNGSVYQFEQTMSVGLAPKTMLSEPRSYFEMGALEINTSANTAKVLTIYNRSSLFNGLVAIIADIQGNQQLISESFMLQNLNITYGYSAIDFTLHIPSGIADGIYDIYVGTKLNESNHWDRVRSEYGSSAEHYLVVENGKAHISSDTDISLLPEARVEPEGTLHSNRKGNFTMTLTNIRQEHDFIGHIELAIYDQYQNMLSSTRIQQVYLKPGETQSIDCSVTMPNITGKAYVCPIWLHNYNRYHIGSLQEITIETQGTPALDIKALECSLENKQPVRGTPFVCNGTVSISGTGNYYEGQLVAYLFNEKSQKFESQSPFINITCEEGQTRKFRIEVGSDLTPGYYQFRLYSYNTNKSSPFTLLWNALVSIKQPTDIQSTTVEEGLRISANTSQINMVSSKPIAQIKIYGIQGTLIKTYSCTENQGTYQIPSSHFQKGVYIVRAIHTDGTQQQTKFCMNQ